MRIYQRTHHVREKRLQTQRGRAELLHQLTEVLQNRLLLRRDTTLCHSLIELRGRRRGRVPAQPPHPDRSSPQ